MTKEDAIFKLSEQVYNLKAENERLKFELEMDKWKNGNKIANDK